MSPSPLPAALIFDCDGTLVLSSDLHFRAFSAAFAAQGLHLDAAFYQARRGMARKDLIADFARISEEVVAAEILIRDSIEAARQLAEAGACAENPPVAALARAWHGAGRPAAVASNGEGAVVRASLEAAGLAGLFATVVTLEDVSRGKPDPEMFLLAAARLGVVPTNCLVLEDSAEGLLAAERAGMAALDVRLPEVLDHLAGWIPRLEAITSAG